MSYEIKEIFYSLQGEGTNAGRSAVFCRFSGCNLWSGRETDRANAVCQFCDTNFVGTDGPNGGRFETADHLAEAIAAQWQAHEVDDLNKFVVCTGGEPLLQFEPVLLEALHALDFEIAVETNGTIPAPPGIDWLCVSPKARANLVQCTGDELKLIYPQRGVEPVLYEDLQFDYFFLQPMAGPDLAANTQTCLRYCLDHPQWRLSLQLHKLLGIP